MSTVEQAGLNTLNDISESLFCVVFSIFLTQSSNTSDFSRIPSSLYVKRKTCSMLQGGKLHMLECTAVHLMHARPAVKMRSRSTCYIIYGCLTPLCKQITETAFDGFANACAPLFFFFTPTQTHTHTKQTPCISLC